MAKSANLYTRIEPEIKEQAETILSTLGISSSSAVNMFYKQIVLQRGIPFELKLPKKKLIDMSKVTDETINKELEKGYTDVKEGKVKTAKEVFNDIRKDYNL
ncbi:MAG: type II toxin-antitoxin system RelB/DinJ family antitoxin [Caldisericia bacterium]|nr:type II toxin-antitoxin system RelB/DinJ family antitoxin [Caldisericia bacterium]